MAKDTTPPGISSRRCRDQLLTRGDLEDFKQELLLSLLRIMDQRKDLPPKKWLKSHEVRKMLRISNGTLFSMRVNGTIPFTKIGNVIYYDQEEINKLLSRKSA
jgi:hypothetical protein